RLAFRSCSVYTLQEPAFSLTAAINLSPLRDSESLVEVRGQTAVNSAAGGPRRQTSRQTPVSMATIYSSREWLPTPSEGSQVAVFLLDCTFSSCLPHLYEEVTSSLCVFILCPLNFQKKLLRSRFYLLHLLKV
ncbi:Protein glp-1, partial [Dissostichus eleginoides]